MWIMPCVNGELETHALDRGVLANVSLPVSLSIPTAASALAIRTIAKF